MEGGYSNILLNFESCEDVQPSSPVFSFCESFHHPSLNDIGLGGFGGIDTWSLAQWLGSIGFDALADSLASVNSGYNISRAEKNGSTGKKTYKIEVRWSIAFKICMVTGNYYPYMGGVERYVKSIASSLSEKDNEITVLCSKPNGGSTHESYKETRVVRAFTPFHVFKAPISLDVFVNLMNENPDVFHVHATYPSLSDQAVFLSKLRKIPCLVTLHFDGHNDRPIGRTFSKIYNLGINRLIMRVCERVVVTTFDYAKTSVSLIGMPPEKVVEIPPGVDKGFFKHSSRKGKLIRSKFGIQDHENLIGYIGRLAWYKNLDVLIKAFLILKKRYDLKDVHLLIGGDGDKRNEVMRLIEKSKEDVVLTGFIPDKDLPAYYSALDLYVLPSNSRQETFGISLLEALCCGVPVVAPNLPGVRQVVNKSGGGLLFSPGNPFDLAERIARLLNGNLDEYKKSAESFSRKWPSWEEIASKYVQIYREIIGQTEKLRRPCDLGRFA